MHVVPAWGMGCLLPLQPPTSLLLVWPAATSRVSWDEAWLGVMWLAVSGGLYADVLIRLRAPAALLALLLLASCCGCQLLVSAASLQLLLVSAVSPLQILLVFALVLQSAVMVLL